MNIWQIEMERSPYSNTLLFNRNTKLSLSIGLLLLFPALVQGADSLYDQQILQARQGQYAPFLSYLQQYQLRHALTPSQVADWLQVALWAGQDDEVVKVWHGFLLMWAVCSGVIHGVGFRPRAVHWQGIFCPLIADIVLALGLFFFFF